MTVGNQPKSALRAAAVRRTLRRHASPSRALAVARFFKTGAGEYGEGDRFIGVTVPAQRKVARTFRDLPLAEADTLLQSPIHEDRSTALLILVSQFARSGSISRALTMSASPVASRWPVARASQSFRMVQVRAS